MPSLNVIRTLEIRSSVVGASETIDSLNKISGAQAAVGASSEAASAKSSLLGRTLDQGRQALERYNQINDRVNSGMNGNSWIDLASKVYLAKAAYEAVSAASDGASSALAKANAGMMNGAKEAAMYLPNAIADVWQQGIDKIIQYVDLSQKAGTMGTDFYQALVLGATNAGKAANDYLKIVETIGKALDRQLGATGAAQNGSAFNTMVLELQKNGNLQSQAGAINRLNNSVTAPEQLNAAVRLIQGALDAGEKLVAFKLAGTLLGPEAMENLKNDNDYLFKMQQSIANVQGKDIIKQTDIDHAAAMTVELANAQKIINSWFSGPVKSDWSNLGMEIQQLWINAHTNIASLLTLLDQMLGKTKEIAEVKPDPNGSIWTQLGNFFSDGSLTTMTDAERQRAIAEQTLASRMGNPQNIRSAGIETQRASDTLGPDNSTTGAWKAATDAVQAYITATNTAASSVGATAGAQETAKIKADLYAAALKEGLSPALAQAAVDANGLAIAAGNAADALDRAQKMSAGLTEFKSALDSLKNTIATNQIQIDYFGKPGEIAAQLKQLELINIAKKTMSDDDARAAVTSTGLTQKLKEQTDQLAALNKTDPKDAYSRAEEAARKYIETTKASTTTIDQSAGAQEKARIIAQLTAAGLKDGLTPAAAAAKAEMSGLGDEARKAADDFARAKVASQINFSQQTVGLSQEDVQIATQLKAIYPDVSTALASVEAQQIRVANAQHLLADGFREVGQAVFTAFVTGKSVTDAMIGALDNLAKKLSDAAFNNILSGILSANPVQVGIGVIEAGAAALSSLVSGNLKAEQELKKNQDAWHKMIDQVIAFNAAAAGFNLGPLTQALQSLFQTQLTLATAAYNAHDTAGLASIQNTFNQGVVRLVNEFQRGSDVLTPYAQAVKDLNDEAQGLIDTLNSENLQGAAGAVAAALPDRVAALTKQYTDNLVTDLTNRLNTANGQDYLNSASALVTQHNADILAAQQLGVSMDLVNQTFAAGAQKIVNDAGLTGAAFDAFIAKFPELAGVVQQATAVISRSADQIAQAKQSYDDQLFALQQDQTTLAGQLAVFDHQAAEARASEVAQGGQALVDLEALQAAQRLDIEKKYYDQQAQAQQQAAQQFQSFLTQLTTNLKTFVDGLSGGSNSILSPLQKLQAAQSQYNSQLALAQGGNQDAANSITQYASNVIDAEKSYYGSSQPTQDLISQITAQLNALPSQISATQQVVNAITAQTSALQAAFAAGDASAIATALLPSFNQLTANTNGLLSFSQFQTIAGNLADSTTLHSIFNTLDTDGNGQIDRLEAIKAATGTTSTNIGSGSAVGTTTVLAATNNVAAVVNSLYVLSNNALPAIATNSGNIANNTGYLPNINSTLSGISGTLTGMFTAMTQTDGTNDYLNRIRANLVVLLNNIGSVGRSGASLQGFATGGIVGGIGSGTSDSNLIWASVGEGIINAASTAALGGASAIANLNAGRVPLLPVIAGNDNSALLARMDRLVAANERLEARLAAIEANTGNNVKATVIGAQQMVEGIGEIAQNTKAVSKAARRTA